MNRIVLLLLILNMNPANAQIKNSGWLEDLLRKDASPLLAHVLDNPDTFHYQIIYTKIDRQNKNKPIFTHYYLNVDRGQYFNPASMVKLPTALAALEKLNILNLPVDIDTPMLTDSSFSGQTAVLKDETSENGLPSIGHYIKKIFLVSDNDAYNRIYEFAGQKFLNECLWQKGYTDMRITRRFVPMTPEENRHTNAIRFVQDGQTVYEQPAAYSDLTFDFSKKILVGKAHLDRNDNMIPEPMDFTQHNNAPLEDLQQIMQSVLFPESVPEQKRFKLTPNDLKLLYRYMSELPSESSYPKYDTTEFFDSYTKFFFFRDGRQKLPPYIRSFNKTGWSYGFLTDVCYIVDFKHDVEFMLSGNIYVNSNGVLNDNKYEYDEIGYPFFREVGEKIYQYELKRQRKQKPDLSKWKLLYD
ncbi:MAG: serine hydrolase [Niabella sp.]